MIKQYVDQLIQEASINSVVDASRMTIICHLAHISRLVNGNAAEIGVYKGGTAKLIAKSLPDRHLYLFDTFAGMPETDKTKDIHKRGDFANTSASAVTMFLNDCGNVSIHPGTFPETAKAIPDNEQFCFVHIDVDIYQSTLSCMQFFFPRVPRGGILICDDYGHPSCPGATQAVDDFLRDKNEEPIIIHEGKFQAVVIKER